MKHFTDSNILVTKMRVPYEDYRYTKVGEAFTEVSLRWQNEPWIKYLYEHGSIDNIDTYKKAEDFSTVYVIHWILDPQLKTLFLLKWSEQVDKIYT